MRPFLGLFLLWASASGQADLGRVHPADQPLRAVVFGDFGDPRAQKVQRAVSDAIAERHKQQPFHLGLTLGDNFYRRGVKSVDDKLWRICWREHYDQLGIWFYATLGNHDYYGNEDAQVAYTQHPENRSWKMPAKYYTFTAGPVRFFALDTNRFDDAQRKWLEERLAEKTDARWRVVYGHHPIYSAGKHGASEKLERSLLPVLQGRADAYLAGHDHDLQHHVRDGFHQFIAGGGGTKPRKIKTRKMVGLRYAEGRAGFLELDAGAGGLRFQFTGTDGKAAYAAAVGRMRTRAGPVEVEISPNYFDYGSPEKRVAVLKGAPAEGYPPAGEAYRGANAAAHYAWRWIAATAPDEVVIDGHGPLKAAFPVSREEMARRLARTPREVAEQLARHYGHALDEAVYIPAVALMARLRLGAAGDVERIVKPYYDGAKRSLPEKITGSHFSGHLVFGELYRLTRKPRYLELARAAADAMPYEDDMSDAVFMGCPILVQTGRLADEPRYFDAALRHFEKMRQLDLRKDGLYRHSPLDETAWGRGNGFPALGLALSLSDLPEGHAAHNVMLRAFREHMAALAPHQDALTGMWHQVVDHPESYRELTATAMIAFAMHRGAARGWLERERYQPLVERAWTGLKARIAEDGTLLDVCTGTGKQRSLRDYLERTAIWGKDPRGGAMALLAAVELAGLR